MKKWISTACAIVALGSIFGLGCDEWLVGAPCTPETDKGTFTLGLQGENFAIETRNVQCQGSTPMMCVTATIEDKPANDTENLYEKWKDTQLKYSFCSCRCRDAEGNKYDKNSDKYSDLCECPPNTVCKMVLGNNIDEAPLKIRGSYCIPRCIEEGCLDNEACTPSSDSEEPWKWQCRSTI